jgi:hypothetical protein
MRWQHGVGQAASLPMCSNGVPKLAASATLLVPETIAANI